MNFVKAVLLSLLLGASAASAVKAAEIARLPGSGGMIRVDWQLPVQLPPLFRNHCSWDKWSGRPYCSNHCGIDYQFFYCSRTSFGCCHVGRGYCDWNGLLRCTP